MTSSAAIDVESAQEWESNWWESCNFNTFGEEVKQLTYASKMQLFNEPREGKWPVYDLQDKSVLDIGGGPVSMLLKCVNRGPSMVVDPCSYPAWVGARYDEAGIDYLQAPAENLAHLGEYDECWIYNVLLHTPNAHEIIRTAKRHAGTLRIFDWLETEPAPGHPTTLHADELNEWIDSTGTVDYVNENGAVGLAYFGCFSL